MKLLVHRDVNSRNVLARPCSFAEYVESEREEHFCGEGGGGARYAWSMEGGTAGVLDQSGPRGPNTRAWLDQQRERWRAGSQWVFSLVDFGSSVDAREWEGGGWFDIPPTGEARQWPPQAWELLCKWGERREQLHLWSGKAEAPLAPAHDPYDLRNPALYRDKVDFFAVVLLALELFAQIYVGDVAGHRRGSPALPKTHANEALNLNNTFSNIALNFAKLRTSTFGGTTRRSLDGGNFLWRKPSFLSFEFSPPRGRENSKTLNPSAEKPKIFSVFSSFPALLLETIREYFSVADVANGALFRYSCASVQCAPGGILAKAQLWRELVAYEPSRKLERALRTLDQAMADVEEVVTQEADLDVAPEETNAEMRMLARLLSSVRTRLCTRGDFWADVDRDGESKNLSGEEGGSRTEERVSGLLSKDGTTTEDNGDHAEKSQHSFVEKKRDAESTTSAGAPFHPPPRRAVVAKSPNAAGPKQHGREKIFATGAGGTGRSFSAAEPHLPVDEPASFKRGTVPPGVSGLAKRRMLVEPERGGRPQ